MGILEEMRISCTHFNPFQALFYYFFSFVTGSSYLRIQGHCGYINETCMGYRCPNMFPLRFTKLTDHFTSCESYVYIHGRHPFSTILDFSIYPKTQKTFKLAQDKSQSMLLFSSVLTTF